METTLEATFSNWKNLEQAVYQLRRHGVIDIRVTSPVLEGDDSTLGTAAFMSASPATCFPLQVFVEPSRSRQAEDTILQCGGALTYTSAK